MNCNQCGEAVTLTDSAGGTTTGEAFQERYECANGHLGFITGEVGAGDLAWERRGQVFEA